MAKRKRLSKMPDHIPTKEQLSWYMSGIRKGIRIAPKPYGAEWYLEVYANKKWNTSKETYNRENVWTEYYKLYEYYYRR